MIWLHPLHTKYMYYRENHMDCLTVDIDYCRRRCLPFDSRLVCVALLIFIAIGDGVSSSSSTSVALIAETQSEADELREKQHGQTHPQQLSFHRPLLHQNDGTVAQPDRPSLGTTLAGISPITSRRGDTYDGQTILEENAKYENDDLEDDDENREDENDGEDEDAVEEDDTGEDGEDETEEMPSTNAAGIVGSLANFIHHVTSLHTNDFFPMRRTAKEKKEEDVVEGDVFESTQEKMVELISPQRAPLSPPVNTTRAEVEDCPAIFSLPGCKPRKLPSCLPLGAFNQKWFSLSKKNWQEFLRSPWGMSMRASHEQVRALPAKYPVSACRVLDMYLQLPAVVA